MCSIKFYRIILITIVFVRCADKPGNNDQSLVSYTDSEEEEDNFNVTESAGPSKSSETTSFKHFEAYNKIIFIKKNEEGIMVPMEEGDYKVTSEDLSKIEYMFQASLEMVLYNYEVIFEHVPGKPYTLTLTYYKDYNVVTMQDADGFTFIRHEGGKWRVYSRRRSGYLKLYTLDKGKEVELGEGDYYVTFGPKGLLRYEFKKNIECHKIMFSSVLVWKKEINKPCPSKVGISVLKDIVLYFDDHFVIFLKSHNYSSYIKKPRK